MTAIINSNLNLPVFVTKILLWSKHTWNKHNALYCVGNNTWSSVAFAESCVCHINQNVCIALTYCCHLFSCEMQQNLISGDVW